MLTKAQQEYLLTIPEDKVVKIHPFDPKIPNIAKDIIDQVHSVKPDLEVLFMGASGLGISGQGDLDLYMLSSKKDFEKYLLDLTNVLGEPAIKGTSIKWQFEKDGHEIEIYLTDPTSPSMQKQVKVFEMLKNNPDLLKEYKELKESSDGLLFREYMKRKYEFYNRLLG